jgi:hypothetical protein
LVRFIECRFVGDQGRIEHDDIGTSPWPQDSAIADPDALRRHGGHLSYGFFERKKFLLAYVPAEDAGEGAVAAGMRSVFAEDRHLTIGGNHRGGMLQDPVDVGFRHAVVNGAHIPFLDQLHHRVGGVLHARFDAAGARDVGESLAGQRRVE